MPVLQRGFFVTFVLIGACVVQPPPPQETTGTVEFFYNLIGDDGTGQVLAVDCARAGVDMLRFAVGYDLNQDGALNAFEETSVTLDPCIQADRDANGVFDLDEIGYFGPNEVRVGNYGLFSVQILNPDGEPMPWRVFNAQEPAYRFTFQQGVRVDPGGKHFISFPGGEDRLDLELEIFLSIDPLPLPEEPEE